VSSNTPNEIIDIPESVSDNDLVKLCLQEQDNFKYIILRYQNKFQQYIFRRTKVSKEDSEDLLQDIFIKIYLNLRDFDTSLKFSSWGYRIAHNEIISWYRKKKIRPQINFEDYEEDNFINFFREETDIEKQWGDKEVKKHIREAIEKLDEKYKDVIVLRFLEEKDYTEIGDILQIPTGTVSTLISRGKKELQKHLQKYI
jgi:RNA polymerase sigma-70 factor (ECF subfamily)